MLARIMKPVFILVICSVLVSSGVLFIRSSLAQSAESASPVNLIVRSVTFRVAAYDSSPASKAQADFVLDGISDEIEINQAIALTPANGNQEGGSVSISEGNINITGSLVLKSGVSLIGQGWRATYINKYADVDMITALPGATAVTLRGFTLDGRRDVGGFLTGDGISLIGPNFLTIEDVWIRRQGGWAIKIEGNATYQGFEILLNRIVAINNGDGLTTGGIYLYSNPNLEQVRIVDSSLTEHTFVALLAYSVNLLRVSRLHVEQANDNFHAIEFDETSRSYIEGSYVTDGNIGIYFYDTRYTNALNNYIKGTNSRAIRLYSAERSVVMSNIDEDGKGIIAMNGGAYNILMGNISNSSYGWGVITDEPTTILEHNIGQVP